MKKKNGCYVHNYQHAYNGRIWIGWNPSCVDVNVLEACDQAMAIQLTELCIGISFYFIAVYGCHSQELRKGFWSFITTVCSQDQGPCMICGDFHSVLLTEDRVNGVPVSASEIADFTDCMSSHSLYQVKTAGAS